MHPFHEKQRNTVLQGQTNLHLVSPLKARRYI